MSEADAAAFAATSSTSAGSAASSVTASYMMEPAVTAAAAAAQRGGSRDDDLLSGVDADASAPLATAPRARMDAGTARAVILIAWSLCSQSAWHGPYFALFKRAYLWLSRACGPLDVARLMSINLAVQHLSPFPHLALGSFLVHTHHGHGTSAQRKLSSVPSSSVDLVMACPPGVPLSVRDPLGNALLLRVPKLSVAATRFAPILLEEAQALGERLCQVGAAAAVTPASSCADAGVPAVASSVDVISPADAALAALGTALLSPVVHFLSDEGLYFDMAWPDAAASVRIATPMQFTPQRDALKSSFLMEQQLAMVAGWDVHTIASFDVRSKDDAALRELAQRTLTDMTASWCAKHNILLPGSEAAAAADASSGARTSDALLHSEDALTRGSDSYAAYHGASASVAASHSSRAVGGGRHGAARDALEEGAQLH
ncbi:MAG: hypothetical protein EOO41_03365 [Methanobacteriota archaeon]|nr:MAG: hypothetical protein EOO41_03365 [Euryarchaeota archaeon]